MDVFPYLQNICVFFLCCKCILLFLFNTFTPIKRDKERERSKHNVSGLKVITTLVYDHNMYTAYFKEYLWWMDTILPVH